MKRYCNCSKGKFAITQAYLERFQNVIDFLSTAAVRLLDTLLGSELALLLSAAW
jgi:hypothetical protein